MTARLALATLLVLGACSQEAAKLPFDFYVLALSWSPTHCGEPGMEERDQQQCGAERRYGFVVHGLWPQFEEGFPRSCPTARFGPNPALVTSMLDIMPSSRLVEIQWERHGTCSGLAARNYFATLRAARSTITIPPRFQAPEGWQRLSADEVEADFIRANPALGRDTIAVQGRDNRLREVRICLTTDLAPRPCPEVDERGIDGRARLAVPPTRISAQAP